MEWKMRRVPMVVRMDSAERDAMFEVSLLAEGGMMS